MSRLTMLAGLLLLSLPACRTAQPLPAGRHVGASVQAQPSVRLATVAERPREFLERTLLVEATVLAVCQKKGCWMQVEDGGRTALVRWEEGCGGAYAFPVDASGKRVLIQGSFYPKTLTEEDAEHMEEEAGGQVALERAGYELNASALIVLDV
jgi:hypothetical protein